MTKYSTTNGLCSGLLSTWSGFLVLDADGETYIVPRITRAASFRCTNPSRSLPRIDRGQSVTGSKRKDNAMIGMKRDKII